MGIIFKINKIINITNNNHNIKLGKVFILNKFKYDTPLYFILSSSFILTNI